MPSHRLMSPEPIASQSRLQVTVDEAAQLLGYARRTIYYMLERGELRSVGIGRKRRIPVDELRRWQRCHLV